MERIGTANNWNGHGNEGSLDAHRKRFEERGSSWAVVLFKGFVKAAFTTKHVGDQTHQKGRASFCNSSPTTRLSDTCWIESLSEAQANGSASVPQVFRCRERSADDEAARDGMKAFRTLVP